MACDKNTLLSWLSTLPADAEIAIDDGGLTLVHVGGAASFEIGGDPGGDPEERQA